MSTLVFDIETAGEDFDVMDATTRSILTRWIEREYPDEAKRAAALEDVKNGLGFSPLTGEIVAIGMRDHERGKSAVYFQSPEGEREPFEAEGVSYKSMNEATMLTEFWRIVESYDTVVSFNGRGFDAPFLALRSAIHRIRPSRDLLSNRYLSLQRSIRHIDLLDQLTFYGATFKRPSLHLACRAFGIATPKDGGIDGDGVTAVFHEGRAEDIACYNARDILATDELFSYWEQYLRFQ